MLQQFQYEKYPFHKSGKKAFTLMANKWPLKPLINGQNHLHGCQCVTPQLKPLKSVLCM